MKQSKVIIIRQTRVSPTATNLLKVKVLMPSFAAAFQTMQVWTLRMHRHPHLSLILLHPISITQVQLKLNNKQQIDPKLEGKVRQVVKEPIKILLILAVTKWTKAINKMWSRLKQLTRVLRTWRRIFHSWQQDRRLNYPHNWIRTILRTLSLCTIWEICKCQGLLPQLQPARSHQRIRILLNLETILWCTRTTSSTIRANIITMRLLPQSTLQSISIKAALGGRVVLQVIILQNN